MAAHVRSFVDDVESTFGDASAEITAMSADYSGESYDALLTAWAHLSQTHLAAFETGGRTVAAAMETAADLIVAAKVAAIAGLSALALQAGGLLVTGGGAALQPLVLIAARRIVSALRSYVTQYVFCEVIERAIAVFETEIEHIVQTVAHGTFQTASRLLGMPSTPGELRIDTDEVLRRAQVLENYADDIADHYRRFSDNLASLNLDPDDNYDHLVVPPDRAHSPTTPADPAPARQFAAPPEPDRADRTAPKRTTSPQSQSSPEPAHAGRQTSSGSDHGHRRSPELPAAPQPAAVAWSTTLAPSTALPSTAAPVAASAPAADASGLPTPQAHHSGVAEVAAAPAADAATGSRIPQTSGPTGYSTEPHGSPALDPSGLPPSGTGHPTSDHRGTPTTPFAGAGTSPHGSGRTSPLVGPAKPKPRRRQPPASSVVGDRKPAPTPWTTPRSPALPAIPSGPTPAITASPEFEKTSDITDRPVTAATIGRAPRRTPRSDPRDPAQADRTDQQPVRRNSVPWRSNRP
ncbi:hypothetical protein [Nocardia colli]|uniref:hypothetical protein n=1 Tax=Nocardia colli TaxID=2545717 RepID=UPI0035DBC671